MRPPRPSMRSRSWKRRSTSRRPCRSTSTGLPGRTSSAANPDRPPRFAAGAVAGLVVVAAGLRLWGINFGLPALYRPDEDVTVGRAMGILHGVLNPHFADWPHLYFYLSAAWLAPLRLLGLVSDPASGYLGVRVLDALLGSLTVLLVFEFGRRAYGWLVGFFGAAALAVAFLHVRDSHFGTRDIPLSLACVAALYIAYRTLQSRGLWPLLINGITLGVATSLKYNGALVFAGIAAGQTLRARAELLRWPRLLARLALISVLGIVTLALASPFLVLDPGMTQHGIAYAAWRRQPADWIILTFLLVYFLLIGAGRSVFLRYADPMIPLLLLLGGRAQHVPAGGRAAVPYMAGPAHDQAMIDSGEHSHGATDPYIASFLDSRLETQYTIRELTRDDLQLTSLDSFRNEGISYVVVGYETPGTGCGTLSPLEQALRAEGPPLASFSPTNGCPDSVFDPIDTYYVPLAGYEGWVRPGPQIRIYRLAG